MGYILRSGLSFCEASGRLVFLDTFSDRYFCLIPNAERALRMHLSNDEEGAEQALDTLSDGGLLVRIDGRSKIVPITHAVAARSIFDEPLIACEI